MMRKTFFILLAFLFVFGLMGCSSIMPALDTVSNDREDNSATDSDSSGAAQDNSTDATLVYPEDGFAYSYGYGDTLCTTWFTWRVNSAYICSTFGAYTPADGNVLLVADVTIHNTWSTSLEMYDIDFQAQWDNDSDDAYCYPITWDPVNETDLETASDEQLPSTYDLAIDEEVTGLLIYEVPAGFTDFCIASQESFAGGSTGDCFFVYFTAENRIVTAA